MRANLLLVALAVLVCLVSTVPTWNNQRALRMNRMSRLTRTKRDLHRVTKEFLDEFVDEFVEKLIEKETDEIKRQKDDKKPPPPPEVTTDCDATCTDGYCYEKDSTEECATIETDCPEPPADFDGTFECLDVGGPKSVGYNCTTDTESTEVECIPLRKRPKKTRQNDPPPPPPEVTSDCDATCKDGYCYEKDSTEECATIETDCPDPPADFDGTFECLDVGGPKSVGYKCTTDTDSTEIECVPLPPPEKRGMGRGNGRGNGKGRTYKRFPTLYPCNSSCTTGYCFTKNTTELCAELGTNCRVPPANFTGISLCVDFGRNVNVTYDCTQGNECRPIPRRDTTKGPRDLALEKGMGSHRTGTGRTFKRLPTIVTSCNLSCMSGYCFTDDLTEVCAEFGTNCRNTPPVNFTGISLCFDVGRRINITYYCTQGIECKPITRIPSNIGSKKPTVPQTVSTICTNCTTGYCFGDNTEETCATPAPGDCREPPMGFPSWVICMDVGGYKPLPYDCSTDATECSKLKMQKPRDNGDKPPPPPEIETDCDATCTSGYCYEEDSDEVCVDIADDCPKPPADFDGDFVCLDVGPKSVGYNCNVTSTSSDEVECEPLPPPPKTRTISEALLQLTDAERRTLLHALTKLTKRDPPPPPPEVETDCDATCTSGYCYEENSDEVCADVADDCPKPPADFDGDFVCLDIGPESVGYDCSFASTTESTNVECKPLKPKDRRKELKKRIFVSSLLNHLRRNE